MSHNYEGDSEPLGNNLNAHASAVTSQKVTPAIIINLLQRATGSGVGVFLCAGVSVFSRIFCFCDARKREREIEREVKRNSAYSEIKPWSNQLQLPLQFSFSPPCFSTFDTSIVSFNLISVNKCRRRGQRDSPLCQMRSVDISHQT